MATLTVSTGGFHTDTWYPFNQIKTFSWSIDALTGDAIGTKGSYTVTLEGTGLAVTDGKLSAGTIDSWTYAKGTDTLFTLTDLSGFDPLDSDLTNSAKFREALFAGVDGLTGGADAANVIYGYDDDDAITGGSVKDTLKGGDGADSLDGGDGRDKLFGEDGNDQLDGGTGIDTMIGGAGDDTYVVDETKDKVVEYKEQGDDTVNASATYTLSYNIENLSLTGSENIDGTGNNLDNTITGNDGNNLLNGAAGADTIEGGLGDDTLRGGNGDDNLSGGDGTDTVSYAGAKKGVTVDLDTGTATDDSGATDTLAEIENILGGGHADALTGDDADNSIDGGAGKDTLIGGAGDDTLVGGKGIDTADYSGAAGGVTVSLLVGEAADDGDGGADELSGIEAVIGSDAGADTILGDSNANRLEGGEGAFDDSLSGGSGKDTLIGGDGNDSLDGGSGSDSMVGGAGDDTYVVDSSWDKVVEAAEEGTDTVQAWVNYTLGANVERLELQGITDIKGYGSAGDNTFVGNAGNNFFDGKAGIDTIDYSAEDDAVFVDLSTGKAFGNSIGVDTLKNIENIIGSDQNDDLAGNAANNAIDGGDGTDTIDYSGATTAVTVNLTTGEATGSKIGTDTLSNIENITGGSANDTFTGDAGDNVIDGGAGIDTIDYSADTDGVSVDLDTGEATGTGIGTDTLTSIENIIGGAGDDELYGNAAANSLTGGEGEDTINGGAGADHINLTETTSAEDVVELDDFSTADIITGFNVTEEDPTEDFLDISVAQMESEGAFVTLDDPTESVTDTDDPVFATITAATDLFGVAEGANTLIADLAGNIANAAALETALETDGALELTASGAWDIGDSFLAAFDDGTDTFVARVVVNEAVADEETFNDVTATVIAQLVGIDDVTTLAADNFDFIV